MVPQFRPRAALQMITNVIFSRPFAPPLASDAKLSAMTSAEFDSYLDGWTVDAKKSPNLKRRN
jgi:hypothetical protein